VILLDTHAAIWSVEGRLARSIARVIEGAASRRELLISPISAWEIGMLVERGRLKIATGVHEYVRDLFERPQIIAAALSPAIAVEAATLQGSFHGDPADRLIVATAAAYGARLVTRDERIHRYAKATKYIQCVKC
jgi:PIN domain nuclease of toxin-antitoxin system